MTAHPPPFAFRADDLRVVILADHGWINGGQAKVAIDSALSLKQRGIEVCFIAGSGPLDERLHAAGIECRVVGEHDIASDPSRLRAASSGIWNWRAARIVKECIEAGDASSTIVHIHGWAKALSPSVGRVVTQSKAAHVYTLHEYFLACPNGGFFDHQAGRICTRRPLGSDCLTTACDSRSQAQKAWRVARHAVLNTAGTMPRDLREIIYLAPEQRDIMGPFISPKARWHYLPNPVAGAGTDRVSAEDNDLFLFVGRLSPEKGAECAAAAAREAGVKFAVCGDGPTKDAVLNANPDAIMAGWVNQDELAGWMARARCLVFPSLWYEGYPLVVAEALRSGLPIIVSDSCIAVSSVRNGVDGLHARAGDVGAWTQAMQLLKSDELVRSYSEAAFEAGRQLLDDASYTDRLIGIYGRALARHHEPASALEVPALC
jgi:glycosyltransferase involved in cell wall biosynthesis